MSWVVLGRWLWEGFSPVFHAARAKPTGVSLCRQRCRRMAVTLQGWGSTAWPLCCFPREGEHPGCSLRVPARGLGQGRAMTGVSHPLIQGLLPSVALARPNPSLGVFQSLHPRCLGLVFPCLPQDSALLAISMLPQSPDPCQRCWCLHCLLPRAGFPVCPVGQDQPVLPLGPSGEQQIHQLGATLSWEPQRLQPWTEL